MRGRTFGSCAETGTIKITDKIRMRRALRVHVISGSLSERHDTHQRPGLDEHRGADCLRGLLAVTREHHVERDDKEESAEQPSEYVPLNASGDHGTDRGPDEEANREKPCDCEVHMPRAIIPERRQESDRRKKNGKRSSLSLVLREAKEIDKQGNEDFAASDTEQPTDDARQETREGEGHDE